MWPAFRAQRAGAIAAVLVIACLLALSQSVAAVAGAEDWSILSFDVAITVEQDGSLTVNEDITVDFRDLPSHGIFRDIPIEYSYDDRHHRLIRVTDVNVSNAAGPAPFESRREDGYLTLKIGDPDVELTGQQRYRIRYRVEGALNPFDDHDELYWNVTGNRWSTTIERAAAIVIAPASTRATCYQGPTGSDEPCEQPRRQDDRLAFLATRPLPAGSGLTIVVALPKGAVAVAPPMLVRVKSDWEKVRDFAGLKPLSVIAAVVLGIGAVAAVGRLWWLNGRDRWFGDVQYLTGATRESTRPLFARETSVVEFQPPQLDGRRLRPAEIGLLMDERADTLDVSATLVDLAVRGYLRIVEQEKTWIFGSRDYTLEKLSPASSDLLPYEFRLYSALFDEGNEVEMSDLKNKFYTDLAKVKTSLYEQGVKGDKFFAANPESVRTLFLVGGLVAAGAGGGLVYLLGSLGAGVLGAPLVLGGLLVAALHRAMPRRTAAGRELYRRGLGFREYMVTAETDRARFAEEANLFTEYLPYAIVFDCTEKWAEAFEGLETQPSNTSWYVGSTPLRAAAFASTMNSFSGSLSQAIASTPGGSGRSGFSGGSSGGGIGGGGGGRW